MNYITTNIRLPEDDYLRLKIEAAQKRTSLSAMIREKIKVGKKATSQKHAQKLLKEIEQLANQMGKKLRGFDSVKAIREMRYEDQ